jgi:DNA ligase-1
LWSDAGELLNERFPEVVADARFLPDGCVLDGELLVWPDAAGGPLSRAGWRQRVGRESPTRKLLADAPVAFVAGDLFENGGADLRGATQPLRRQRLESLLLRRPLRLSRLAAAADWPAYAALRSGARDRGAAGFILRHRQDPTSAVWLWQADPLSAAAVLVYAQAAGAAGAGYTFAVWNRPPADAAEAQAAVAATARRDAAPGAAAGELRLLPIARIGGALGGEDCAAVEHVVRTQTLERFGPVRSLRPSLVCALAFEGIEPSARHKSGVVVRQPRLLGIRPDTPLHEADSVATLKRLMGQSATGAGSL